LGLIRYVSFSRSIETTKSFNSTSTYINAKFGGNKGLALVKGDKLLFNSDTESLSQIDTKYVAMIITNHIKVRFVEGPEYSFLNQESRKHFETSSFRVSSNLSRVGYRLIGKDLGIDRQNITSRATSRGSVQVPPSGHPIILMADSPVTGGYPRVAQILSDDVNYLSQMKPGSSVRFLKVDSFDY
jgi:antagonist of KipI